jgi:hypothetical protein
MRRADLSGQLANDVVEQAGAESSGIIAPPEIKAIYFHPGVVAQSMLIGLHADRRAEPHVPVAMDDKAELFAAMIAAQCHDPNILMLSCRLR